MSIISGNMGIISFFLPLATRFIAAREWFGISLCVLYCLGKMYMLVSINVNSVVAYDAG